MTTNMYTTPYGSRLYGTSDEKSDWDWKTIIKPSIVDLLVGKKIVNVFKSTSSDEVKNTSEDTDTELVPIQTFCQHFYEGQTYAIELAFGVLQRDKIAGTELHDDRFLKIVNDLISKFMTSNINAMVGYAYNQAQLYSEKGDRLDKLHQFKAFLEWLIVRGEVDGESKLAAAMQFPTIAFDKWKDLYDKLFYVTESVSAHGTQKCFSCLEKLYPENITFVEAIRRIDVNINKYGKRANQAMTNEGKDWKAISHAVRITQEALDVLNKHYVTLPFEADNAEFLKQIKYGKVDWNEVQTLLVKNIDAITESQKVTTLPAANPQLRAEFDAWLAGTMKELYGV